MTASERLAEIEKAYEKETRPMHIDVPWLINRVKRLTGALNKIHWAKHSEFIDEERLIEIARKALELDSEEK